MTNAVVCPPISDLELWANVCQGEVAAFEAVVRRHQSAVAAVAFAVCGDRNASEDITQETFWISWKDRERLADRDRLRPWLCGIARNLARQWLRARGAHAAPLGIDPKATQPEPDESAITAEEEALVWRSLAEIPETYREPLVLYYREQQSMTEVASALDVSVDAIKQRLSRGRSMLRDQVQQLVEGNLRRSRPGAALTVAIMTGLASQKAAWAATASAGSVTLGKTVAASSIGAVAGPVIGTVGGLAGAWMGTWIPAQMAATKREREFILRNGWSALWASFLFTLAMLVTNLLVTRLPLTRTVIVMMVVGYSAVTLMFVLYIVLSARRMNQRLREIRAESTPGADVNDTALRRNVQAICRGWRGRVWQSSWKLCGLPLVDFNVRDPEAPVIDSNSQRSFVVRRACGWIAIGDEARGILLAIGGKARGGIALGGQALGIIAVGGIAVGGIACGGAAFGGIAFGGGALGVLALGGMALGFQACGGMAIAWDIAVGGLAIAKSAAYGGCAIAQQFAVGGTALALQANNQVAEAVLLSHPLKLGMDWYVANTSRMTAVIVAISLLPSVLLWPLMYRRARADELQSDSASGQTSRPV